MFGSANPLTPGSPVALRVESPVNEKVAALVQAGRLLCQLGANAHRHSGSTERSRNNHRIRVLFDITADRPRDGPGGATSRADVSLLNSLDREHITGPRFQSHRTARQSLSPENILALRRTVTPIGEFV